MKELIDVYLRSIGIKSILRKKFYKGEMSCILYDFLNKDGKFCSFLVAYNLTQIIIKRKDNQALIGQSSFSVVQSQLDAGLHIFETKEEYLENRWDISYVNNFPILLARTVAQLPDNFIGLKCRGYEIIEVKPELRLFIGVVIYYTYDGCIQAPIIYRVGCKNVYKVETPDVDKFYELLSRAGCKEIEFSEL